MNGKALLPLLRGYACRRMSSVAGASSTPPKKQYNMPDNRPLYFDHQATTQLDPRVLASMMPYLTERYGNPHSRSHAFGWEAEAAVDEARERIADLINADPREIIFTSGATESNNLALKGVAKFYRSKKQHIITAVTEHKCVLDSCRQLESEGFKVTYLPVDGEGIVELDSLREALRAEKGKTSLVSVMFVNNEIGVVQPISDIGAICREAEVFFHTDAAQGFGKLPMDVNAMNIDLMSISGHKIYGPKGVGALFVRRRPRVRLEPMMSGGGQERGLRSGTLPTPLCVGLGKAAQIAKEDMEADYASVSELSDYFVDQLEKRIPRLKRNGSATPGKFYPGCVNFSFVGVEGESLLMALKDIALSSGSACTSASLEPSYVLRALDAGAGDAATNAEDTTGLSHCSLRFGISRYTTKEEVDYTLDKLETSVAHLRELSPLWEMLEEGVDISKISWTQH